MIDKVCLDVRDALRSLRDGATLLVSGFGDAGLPVLLLDAVHDAGVRELTIVSNNAGSGTIGIARLIAARRVRKVICSFPRQSGSEAFDQLHRRGEIELELVPQGTLAERIRAGGAGIGAFFTPTGVGTDLALDKEHREFGGRSQVLELALRGDIALVRADRADRWGNLTYRRSARNFGPVMATAADCTIAQVRSIVDLGDLDPESVVTPGVFVTYVIPDRQAAGR